MANNYLSGKFARFATVGYCGGAYDLGYKKVLEEKGFRLAGRKIHNKSRLIVMNYVEIKSDGEVEEIRKILNNPNVYLDELKKSDRVMAYDS